MKKGIFAFLIFGIALCVMSVGFVSAAFDLSDFRSISQGVIDNYVNIFEPVLQALFGGYGGWSGLYLFERFLFFILLVSVIYVVLQKVPAFEDQKYVKWIIAIIVPLIGMRFINYEWLSALLLQYQMLAVIITSVIPFMIFFYFLYEVGLDHGTLRMVGWALFIGVYAGLWSTTEAGLNNTVYTWTIAAALVCLVFDRVIARRYRAMVLLRQDKYSKQRQLANARYEISEIEKQIRAGAMEEKVGRKMIKDLIEHEKWLAKQ